MPVIYNSNFSAGPQIEWQTVRRDASGAPIYAGLPRIGATGIKAEGPYWPDENHKPVPGGNGVGYLSLIAVTPHYSYSSSIKPPIVLSQSKIDLRNARLRVTLSATNFLLPRNTTIGLWVQSVDRRLAAGQGRYVNAYNVGRTLCSTLGVLSPVDRLGDILLNSPSTMQYLLFSPDDNDWVCLGFDPARAALYGCGRISNALMEWGVGLGIIALSTTKVDAERVGGSGSITIERLELETV